MTMTTTTTDNTTTTTIRADNPRAAIERAIQGASPASIETIREAGRGAYDFVRGGTYRILWSNGVMMDVEDYWCGGGVEGECYRRHISARMTWREHDGTWHYKEEAVARLASCIQRMRRDVDAAIDAAGASVGDVVKI